MLSPEKFVAHVPLRVTSDHSAFGPDDAPDFLEVAAPQSPMRADRPWPGPQFTEAPFRKRRTGLWPIVAALSAAGLLAFGRASGHPWAAIGVVAGVAVLALLVAIGNHVLDNEMM